MSLNFSTWAVFSDGLFLRVTDLTAIEIERGARHTDIILNLTNLVNLERAKTVTTLGTKIDASDLGARLPSQPTQSFPVTLHESELFVGRPSRRQICL